MSTQSTTASHQYRRNVLSADEPRPTLLAGYPIVFVQQVAWGEMDAFNHLNNVIYFRYAESARIAYLLEFGAFNEQIVTVLAQTSCQYLRPVNFPDTLLIGVRCAKLGNSSITFDYVLYSQSQQSVVAKIEAVIVRLDQETMGKSAWTASEREAILAFEQSVAHTPEQG